MLIHMWTALIWGSHPMTTHSFGKYHRNMMEGIYPSCLHENASQNCSASSCCRVVLWRFSLQAAT